MHGPPVINPAGGRFEIDNRVISYFVMKSLVPLVGLSPFPLNELMLMAGAVVRFRPDFIFEWGTHIGSSARVFHETAKRFGIPSQVHSTDLPDDASHVEHPGRRRGRLVRGLADVHLHQGDGLATSLQIYKSQIPKSSLFFLDGDHAYESVHGELEAIMAAAPEAAILVHDTFLQTEDSGYNVGPWQAIEDALSSMPGRYVRLDTSTGLPGMTLLYSTQVDRRLHN